MPQLSGGKIRKYIFCNKKCFSAFLKERPKELHSNWKGGRTNYESYRAWAVKHTKRLSFLQARRRARKYTQGGSHSIEEWERLCIQHDNKCAICKEQKPLTRDHIMPLSLGGNDYIDNIQPLCRNCNSKKGNRI